MNVRARGAAAAEAVAEASTEAEAAASGQQTRWLRKARHELRQAGRRAVRFVKGHGSVFGYLFIPALVSLLWLIVCVVTTRVPAMTLEERLSETYLKEFFESRVYEDALTKQPEDHDEDHAPVVLKPGETVNVVIAIPFLDVNPLGATEYITTLEWITIYSTVPLTFHVITNSDSIPFVDRVFERVRASAACDFTYRYISFNDIMDRTMNDICPKLTVSEDFCDMLMGKMTPLLFPYLLPELDHVIYVNRSLVFQDNIGLLYRVVDKMKKSKEAIAMAHEQTNTYMRAFAGWQKVNPSTKLGRPPGEGKPGYNADLIVMDLEKLRASASFRSYFSEIRLNKLVKQYFYHGAEEEPSLGDVLNLMAADAESLFLPLGCEWNRNALPSLDSLDRQFNVCKGKHHIRVWNGTPRPESFHKEQQISIGKKYVEAPLSNELR